ncbi:LysM peptidoglycan-binding domain-containing protein [Streptomyces sp. NPDC014685]|uniref:LysM peptidoglycan-binding domain-containing protein n=1 Tax=Streptomyces sp. NPDC014685 TaxID=3364881 RepID=UPI0036F6B793
MAHRTARLPLALLRLTARMAALAVLVAGVPALLLRVGTLPGQVPSLGEAREALMAPDDGSLLFTALTVAAWVAWLWLLVPLLVELVAVIAHRATPRLPGMATSQRLAAYLLGGLLLASPAAAATAATPAVAATTTLDHRSPTAPAPATGHDGGTTAAATTAKPAKEHRVTGEDVVVYDVAEQRLGDGLRWREVARLNPALNITGPSTPLVPGTTLTLPADARTLAPSAPGTGTGLTAQSAGSSHAADQGTAGQEEQDTYTVRPGDTLWGISEKQQGDPTRYTEIVEANPDVIKDPDLIYPGEHLSIPAQEDRPSQQADEPGSDDRDKEHQDQEDEDQEDEAAASPSEPPRASDGEAGTPEQETGSAPSASTSNSLGQERSSSPAAKAPDTGTPSRTAPAEKPAQAGTRTPSAPSASAPSTSSAPSADERHRNTRGTAQDEESASSVTAIALGAGGFVAAGVLLMLRRKRTLQQRRRRPGHRIAMPGGRAASTERTLRCVDAIEEVDFLDAALRTLAHHCAEAERPLPALAAVQLGTEGILLHLADTTDVDELPAPLPLPPFTAAQDSPRVWWCPADTDDLLAADLRGQMDAPYPALVALGDDTHEALLLVDLERFGAVHLTGETRLPVLRALGTSLAVSPLSPDLEIAVTGEDSAPGLSLVDPRVTPYATLADTAGIVRAHHDRQHAALSGSGSADLGAARAADTVDELWPMVVLADLDSCPDPESADQLAQVLQQEPRSATAIITSGHTPAQDTGPVWVLDTDDKTHLVPGTGLRCRLVAFSDEEYADVVESALTSSSETDVAPAPPPTPAAATEDQKPPADLAAAAGPERGAEKPASLLARLADLDSPAPASAPSDQALPALAEKDHGDNAAPEPGDPSPPPAEAVRSSGPQTDTASPSRIVLPATTPLTPAARVTARLPEPVSPPAPAHREPTPTSTGHSPVTSPAAGDTSESPVVRVLGPVDVTGARGHIDSNRRTVATELTCWLALRTDGATRHELDEVIAPGGGRVENNTRNGRIREVRRWLGEDETGTPYYPKLNTQADRKHRLVSVACDWHQFQDLTAQAAAHDGDQARTLLRRALELVRGRPFTGIPPRRYVWAEVLAQDMVSAVVDAADDLAARCLADGDAQGALWAAGRGLDTGREREILWRHRFEALAQLGAHDELEAAIQQLNQYLLEADLPMEPETEQTIRRLDAVRR